MAKPSLPGWPPGLESEPESEHQITSDSHTDIIVMELSLSGRVQFLSQGWEDIIGSPVTKVLRKPISRVLVGSKTSRNMFVHATEVMRKNRTSFRVRCLVKRGPGLDGGELVQVNSVQDQSGSMNNQASFVQAQSRSSSQLTAVQDQHDRASSSSGPSSGLSNSAFSSTLGSGFSSGSSETTSKPSRHRRHASQIHVYEDYFDPASTAMDTDDDNASVASVDSSHSLDHPDAASIEMDGQGILIHDRNGVPHHTMWILRPYVPPRPLRVDVPQHLVDALGFGVYAFVSYLEEVSETGASSYSDLPPPPDELCRICERRIPNWWFERHSELCIMEHRAESELQIAHESLLEQRVTLARILSSFECSSDPDSDCDQAAMLRPGSRPASPPVSSPRSPVIEYRGLSLPIVASPPPNSPPCSPRLSAIDPVSTQGRALSPPKRALNKHSMPAQAARKSSRRLLELLLELCDMALQINSPEVQPAGSIAATASVTGTPNDRLQVHSPQSETRIHQVNDWNSHSVDDPGLALLCSDTEALARAKTAAALRLGHCLVYSDRMRLEAKEGTDAVIDSMLRKMANREEFGNESTDPDSLDEADEDDLSDNMSEPGAFDDQAMFPTDDDNLRRNHKLKEKKSVSSESSLFSTVYLQSDELPQTTGHSSAIALSQSPSQTSNLHGSDKGSPSSKPASLSVLPDAPPANAPAATLATTVTTISPRKVSSIRLSIPHIPRRESSFSPVRQPWSSLTDSDRSRSRMSSEGEGEGEGSPGDNSFNSILSRRERSLPRLQTRPVDFNDDVNELDLNNPRLRQRRSASNMSLPVSNSSPRSMFGSVFGSGSPLKRLHRGPSTNTPTTAPSSFVDYPSGLTEDGRRHLRRTSANSDSYRTSPLLTSTVPSSKGPNPSIRDYEIISPISKGAFGSVYLTKKKLTGEYFAIKVLKKADMVAKNQVMNVKAERAILMAQSDSPCVAKLYYTFQNRDYLFLVMEYLNGGDCAALIKALGGISVVWAQSYMAEVVVGVGDMHKKGIVHRDLKPDNLLIDNKGHLKLTDFGLSRMGLVGRQSAGGRTSVVTASVPAPLTSPSVHTPTSAGGTLLQDPNISLVPGYFSLSRAASIRSQDSGASSSSDSQMRSSPPQLAASKPPLVLFDPSDRTSEPPKFVGTPDYLAPETIRGAGQDDTSDWWSLGCILFEFLYGYPPFHDESPAKVFRNILDRNIQWPDEAEDEDEDDEERVLKERAKDLVNRLLCMDQNQRLGANGVEEVKAHPFFEGISNWDTLWDGPASFVPSVEHPESTDYFDSRGAVMEEFPQEMTDIAGGGDNGEEDDVSAGMTSIAEAGALDYQSDSDHSTGSRGSGRGSRPSGSPSRASKNDSVRMKYMPLHIPPHVRDGRIRRLSEPVATDDFGTFAFKNLSELERANRELITKMRLETREPSDLRARGVSVSAASTRRQDSPISSDSTASDTHAPLHAPVPVHRRAHRHSLVSDPSRGLVSPDLYPQLGPGRASPSSSIDEEAVKHEARASRARRTGRLASVATGPVYRPLQVLVCDMNPVWRYSTEKLLGRLGCRVVSVSTGTEAIRRASGGTKFDVIIVEYRLPKTSGSDVARLIHSTMNPNTDTPIVCMTSFVREASEATFTTGPNQRPVFEAVMEKPPSMDKLVEQLTRLCLWKPKVLT